MSQMLFCFATLTLQVVISPLDSCVLYNGALMIVLVLYSCNVTTSDVVSEALFLNAKEQHALF